MSSRTPVLLVEGDRQFGASLARELAADGFSVELAHSAPQARDSAQRRPPEIVLVGRLATSPSSALLEEIRAAQHGRGLWKPALPVLALGEQAGGLEALRALDAGADDYMARPISYLELRARMRAILRRVRKPASSSVIEVATLRVDPAARRAVLAGRGLALSRTEFDLLARLAGTPERVFSRPELLSSVWGYRCDTPTRTVDTHASRLRRKLAAGSDESWIIGIRGVGYRLI